MSMTPSNWSFNFTAFYSLADPNCIQLKLSGSLSLLSITGNKWNFDAGGGLKNKNRSKMNGIQGPDVRFENDFIRFIED